MDVGQLDGWMDGQTNEQMTDGWMDGWIFLHRHWPAQCEAQLKPEVKELRRLLCLQIFQPSFILRSADVFLPFLRNQIHSSEALIWALICPPHLPTPPLPSLTPLPGRTIGVTNHVTAWQPIASH